MLRLEYLSVGTLCAVFLALSAFIVVTGTFSLNGLGTTKKWIAIGLRLAVLLVLLLIIAGAQWTRRNFDLQVMFVRDISQSTQNVRDFPGKSLQSSLDTWFLNAAADRRKQTEDTVGVISFNELPLIDEMFTSTPQLDNRSIRGPGTGTDAAAAINLGLAAFQKDAMHRIVLAWDGNDTTGDLDSAIASAAALHVPIDVFPLNYKVGDTVMVDHFVAPTWKREKDPFTLDVFLRNTARNPVSGTLTVTRNYAPFDTRRVTLKPGLNALHIHVPAIGEPGLQRFHTSFQADGVGNESKSAVALQSADAFTFVKGRGKILYVDAVENGGGRYLRDALAQEGVRIEDNDHITPDHFPHSLAELQGYDAVILANVARGPDGLAEDQQAALASYVHDTGGGLVMVGGPTTFGAGGWEGSKLAQILPVNLDVPAQRQIPKGALVLVMDPCEMPEGTYWGIQCGLQAVSTLSSGDDIGIISWNWNGNGYHWDLPLQKKGDGEAALAALKKMQPDDMPSFDDPLRLALRGTTGTDGLLNSDAQQKHVIIISDGDPGGVDEATYQAYINAKISVSTVEAYAHDLTDPNVTPIMSEIPRRLHGRAYGPINSNPNQLPRIFIKEATVVRRTLIQERQEGIPVTVQDASSDLVKGLSNPPSVYGMVLTSRKEDPKISIPLTAGKMHDPLLADWQIGLGHVAAFTSDANTRWDADWIGSGEFPKFWAQVVRSVVRPPMDNSMDLETSVTGSKGHISLEAIGQDDTFLNFQNISGTLIPPDMRPREVQLVQTAPGQYAADFDAKDPGEYVVLLQRNGKSSSGLIVGGVAVSTSEELRALQSNPAVLARIAARTGGTVLTPFDPDVNLFRRDGLSPATSVRPIWDVLIPLGVALMLTDIALRRIAIDRQSLVYVARRMSGFVRSFTETRQVAGDPMVGALRRAKASVANKTTAEAGTMAPPPDPRARFQAKGVEGDLTKVVGGATNTPIPAPKRPVPSVTPAGENKDPLQSLQEAKRRARERIEKASSQE